MNSARTLGFLLLISVLSASIAAHDGKTVVGWEESVIILPHQIKLLAKLDSGAHMASLHCGCTYFRKNNKTWVRLKPVASADEDALEFPILRYIDIKKHGGELQRRPVIQLNICLAGVSGKIDVNLVDRGKMTHKLLIGREFLSNGFLIDPLSKQLTRPRCK